MNLIDARQTLVAYDRAVSTPKPRSFADTAVLPRDELAIRRERNRKGQLTPSQIQRLLVAAALREKATAGERDE